MGMMPPPEQCYITDLPTEDYPSTWDIVEYIVELNGRRILFRFPLDFERSEFVNENLHMLHGLLLNGKFPPEYSNPEGPILNNDELEKIINESNVPSTTDEKISNLLTYLHSLQIFEGSEISFPDNEDRQDLARRLYFKNYPEMVFYLFTLYNQGLIDGIDASTNDGNDLISIKLTYEGLATVIELADAGSTSDRCFVAMSFSDDLRDTREAIKTAIREAGFNPILIDEIHIDADVTINDALIAEIKKSKFLVADFTQHKHGVYFEAGFALGLKRPVIYLCHQDDFENTHFDTNHYPHIIYQELQELTQKLKTKIEAWIV